MIRFRIGQLIADKEFNEGRRITLIEVAAATGVNRMTLSRMINTKGYNAGTDTLNRLCGYFGCQVGDVAVFVEDQDTSSRPPDGRHKTDGQIEG